MYSLLWLLETIVSLNNFLKNSKKIKENLKYSVSYPQTWGDQIVMLRCSRGIIYSMLHITEIVSYSFNYSSLIYEYFWTGYTVNAGSQCYFSPGITIAWADQDHLRTGTHHQEHFWRPRDLSSYHSLAFLGSLTPSIPRSLSLWLSVSLHPYLSLS